MIDKKKSSLAIVRTILKEDTIQALLSHGIQGRGISILARWAVNQEEALLKWESVKGGIQRLIQRLFQQVETEREVLLSSTASKMLENGSSHSEVFKALGVNQNLEDIS